MKEHRLVYSTDPELNRRCAKCKELESECVCRKEDDPGTMQFVARLRIERKGRGGKTVTVVAGLPRTEAFLKELCQTLKRRSGSGGTWRIEENEGVIEVQGEKLTVVRQALEGEGIRSKG